MDRTQPNTVRHREFYIRGGDVTFLVENHVLFRVHKYFFERDSAFFASHLAAPAAPGAPVTGTTDRNAFPLLDVTVSEFERFLWVFYNPRYNVYNAPKETWIAIVRLGHLWQFSEVQRMATRYLNELQDFDPVDKIELFRAYDLDRTLLGPTYLALVARSGDLSLEECSRLEMDTTWRIFIARTRALRDGVNDLPSLRAIVADVFELDLSTTG